MGFVCGAGYTSAMMLVCGFLVSYPQLGSGLYWMQWGAFMKYSFQVRTLTLTLTLALTLTLILILILALALAPTQTLTLLKLRF